MKVAETSEALIAKHAAIVEEHAILEVVHIAAVHAALEAAHIAVVLIASVEDRTGVAVRIASVADHMVAECHMAEDLTVVDHTEDILEAVGNPTTPTHGPLHSSSAEYRSLIFHNILPGWPC